MFDHLLGSQRLNLKKVRQEYFKKMIEPQLFIKNEFKEIEVRHCQYLNKEFLKSLPSDKPVVIKGLIDQAECLRTWDWEYINQKLGKKDMPYIDTFTKDKFHTGVMKGKDIIHNLLSPSPRYSILFSNLNRDSRELIQDLSLSKWLKVDAFKWKFNKSWQVFLAGKGRSTKLHSELGTTLSLQILGEKKWILFPPGQTIHINPKINWKMYLESQDEFELKDFYEKPLGLKGYEVLLSPGDVLYFPACYWHHVENITQSVSVSYKWTEVKSFLQIPKLSFILLTSRNPLVLFRLPLFKKFSTTYPPVG